MDICYGEVNFLTKECMSRANTINAIRQEFDFISFCQAVIIPFGLQAKDKLDHFLALSMRKLLFDNSNALILKVCPDFMMPPLSGKVFFCPGYQNDMMLNTIETDIHIVKQEKWLPFDEWKDTRVSWIEKSETDVPTAVSDHFYTKVLKGTGNNRVICNSYERKIVEQEGKKVVIWEMKNPVINQKKIYEILKKAGYYDLTIQRLVKNIADTKAAHVDNGEAVWIHMENMSGDFRQSAISVFATHMIYAATKQIKELSDYWIAEPLLETL